MQFGEKTLLQRWTKKGEREEGRRREWGGDPEGGGKRRRGRGRDGRGWGTDLVFVDYTIAVAE
jgi:hypothetical protein